MAGRRRCSDRSSVDLDSSSSYEADLSSSSSCKKKKRCISIATFNKWKVNYDSDHQTLTWLKCEQRRGEVTVLWCSVCREYQDKVYGSRNMSEAWITGSENQRTSNLLDHAKSVQHKGAMSRHRTAQAKSMNQPITSFSPIAKGLLSLGESEKARLTRKFDICYMMAKESLAFEKYASICELEVSHGVDLGSAYKTAQSAKLFTHFIAQSCRNKFLGDLRQKKFYSFSMDGSTDAARIEQELIIIHSAFKDDFQEKIKSLARFFSVASVKSANASGLLTCASHCLSDLGVTNLSEQNLSDVGINPVLVGCGTDGASVNVGGVMGLKGLIQHNNTWIMWSWCYAHRLELACKNAFSSSLFKCIEEMLLRLYYLYEKSPKKIRELEDVVKELQGVFELPSGGNIPVRASGCRWITHKRNALLRIMDRYGAYIAHLTTLSEDRTVKPEDRARLKGYLKKWMDYRMLYGCALYADILKPVSLLSLSLQGNDLDIVLGIKNILKANVALKNLCKQSVLEWPTVKLFNARLKDEPAAPGKSYQGSPLNCASEAETKERCRLDALMDLDKLNVKMKERLEWSDSKLLRSLLVFLETQTWVKRLHARDVSVDSLLDDNDGTCTCTTDASLDEVKDAVEHIATHFKKPLEAKGLLSFSLPDEVEEIVEYGRTYLSLSHTPYRKVWYKLNTCPDIKKWPNILMLMELCFSLPFSNGRVEQIFSGLKVVKTNRRVNMASQTLNDLLEIYVEGPKLAEFCQDTAIELWWKDSTTPRRPNQGPRNKKSKDGEFDSDIDTETDELDLTLWDEWMNI